MSRKNSNWIGLGVSLLYLICFLFLPFLQVVIVLGVKGLDLLQFGYGIMYIPLVLGIAMAVSSVAVNERISIIVGAVSFLITLVMLLAGRSILLGGDVVSMLIGLAGESAIVSNIASRLPVSIGLGGIVCMILAAAHVATEFLMNRPAPAPNRQSERNILDDNIF